MSDGTHSITNIINPDLCFRLTWLLCALNLQMILLHLSSLSFSFSLLSLHSNLLRKTTSSISAEQKRGDPPNQRKLFTCVLSAPSYSLWIKEEIVSQSLIFHHAEMLSSTISSDSCAVEIILAHSGATKSIFLELLDPTSPWLCWGHQCPNWIEVPQDRAPSLAMEAFKYLII